MAQFRQLMEEAGRLDRDRDALRLSEIYSQAAELVDRQAEPKKWAAMRYFYAQVAAKIDPSAAAEAYREALPVWDPATDHDALISCELGLGELLFERNDPALYEEAIAHLERAVNDYPYVASYLTFLYRYRFKGDLAENWKLWVKYALLALDQVPRGQDPEQWATRANELGKAYSAEPAGDFNAAIEVRLDLLQQALQALGTRTGVVRANTCLGLAECYLFRVQGNQPENRNKAEEYARQALEIASAAPLPEQKRLAQLSLARTLGQEQGVDRVHALQQALVLLDQAAASVDARQRPELAANVDQLKAAAYLSLIQAGERQFLEPLAASSEAAIRNFVPIQDASNRRSVLQVAGEGMLECGDFDCAAGFFERALVEGETALAPETTIPGKLERIFQLGETCALLSYCYLKLGRNADALNALDRGKTRLWPTSGPVDVKEALARLIPAGGAALFPNLAAAEGSVIVVARKGEVLQIEPVWLPDLGKREFLKLQRGDHTQTALGGWLGAYYLRNSDPDKWRQEIELMGQVLYSLIWARLIPAFNTLCVKKNAELIWFPSGGSGVLPVHAAWKEDTGLRHWLLEDYAVRYAPSVRSLAAAGRWEISPMLLISDPAANLSFSALERGWVEKSLASNVFTVLAGTEATKDHVLQAMPLNRAVHFSTHAEFDVKDPFGSRIYLANNEWIALADLLPVLAKNPPGFVVLSACETAMTRVTFAPNEFLGLPSALLDHGVASVLATLWAVEDDASAFLVGRFYKEISSDVAPSEALRRAQNWLREATAVELSASLDELIELAPPIGPRAARAQSSLFGYEDTAKPFAHPYFWAPFTVSGC